MKAIVKKLEEEQSIIDFHTETGVKKLEINVTDHGYSYKDFSEWDITDDEYCKIEEIVDKIIDKMGHEDEIIYDLD